MFMMFFLFSSMIIFGIIGIFHGWLILNVFSKMVYFDTKSDKILNILIIWFECFLSLFFFSFHLAIFEELKILSSSFFFWFCQFWKKIFEMNLHKDSFMFNLAIRNAYFWFFCNNRILNGIKLASISMASQKVVLNILSIFFITVFCKVSNWFSNYFCLLYQISNS